MSAPTRSQSPFFGICRERPVCRSKTCRRRKRHDTQVVPYGLNRNGRCPLSLASLNSSPRGRARSADALRFAEASRGPLVFCAGFPLSGTQKGPLWEGAVASGPPRSLLRGEKEEWLQRPSCKTLFAAKEAAAILTHWGRENEVKRKSE